MLFRLWRFFRSAFPLFLGRVFSPPRVWLGRDVQGRGTARSRLRLKACDSMTVFHGLLACFFFFFFFFFALLTGGPSPSYNGRDCPVWGSPFLLRRMNGCREVPCPGHEADSPWHPQERHGIHVCPAAKTVSPRLRRIPENGFSATLRTSCSFSEIVPKEICFF